MNSRPTQSDGRSSRDARARLDRLIAARFTADQSDRLFELAAERETTVSELIREATDGLLVASR